MGSFDGRLTWRARLPLIALLAITAAGGALRFYRIDRHGFWLDEAFSVWMADHPLPELFGWLTAIDQHPPLYYTLLHFWLPAGDQEGTVRALSALLSTLAIPVLFLIGRRLGGVWVGLAAALLLALSPFQVRFAQEARMYALLTLAVALALWGLVGILTDNRRGMRSGGDDTAAEAAVSSPPDLMPLLIYVIFTAAAVLTHSTAVFFPLAANLFVLGFIFYRRKRPGGDFFTPPPLRTWLLAQAGVILLWLPWSYSFVIQAAGVYNQFWIQPPAWGTVLATFSALLNDFLSPRLPGVLVWAGYALLLLLGGWALRRRLPVLALLLVLLLAPVLGELLVSLRRPIFYDRTLIWLALPLCLLLAFGLAQVRPKPLAVLALALLVGANLLSLQHYYDTFKKEQWREAAAWLARKAGEDDLILFNATWVQIPFDYYFRRHDLGATQHGVPADLFDAGVLEPIMTEADLPRLRALLEGHDRAWLVYSHDWYTDPQKLIPAALEKEMRRVRVQRYYGLEVLEYRR